MLAQGGGLLHFVGVHAVDGTAYFRHVFHFDHDVYAAAFHRKARHGQAVVAAVVAVEEMDEQYHAFCAWRLEVHDVGQARAHHIFEEGHGLGKVRRGQHGVTHANAFGDEARHTHGRSEVGKVRLEAPAHFVQVACRVGKADHLLHAALAAEVGAGQLVCHAMGAQGFYSLGKTSFARHFPARGYVGIARARLHDEAKLAFVHAYMQATVGGGGCHHAQHVLGKVFPTRHIGGLCHHVGQSANVHHAQIPSCPPATRV